MRKKPRQTPDVCPDCGGDLAPVQLVSRGPDSLAGRGAESTLKFYIDAESDRVQQGETVAPKGTIKALVCGDCHRLLLWAVPSALEGPAQMEPTVGPRGFDEPLALARDATDGYVYLRLDQEGLVSIIELLAERIKVLDDAVHQRIAQELLQAVEVSHARVLLDLGNFVPWYHSSAFVANLLKFKRRWLERHAVPGEGRSADDPPASPGAKMHGQPTVRQLAFPIAKDRAAALAALTSAPEGTTEVSLCGVAQSFYDVLKVTRLCR